MKNNRIFALLLSLALLASFWKLQSLARFMLDPTDSAHAIAPFAREFDDESMQRPFFPTHCCFTCYVVAQELALAGVANIYSPEHYGDGAKQTSVHTEVAGLLHIDRYQYPPIFLLLPWGLAKAGGSFLGARKLFFFLNLAVFALCLICLQRCLAPGLRPSATAGEPDSWSAKRTWLAWPVVLLATTTLTTLQIGNVHALVMMLAVLGMLAVSTGRHRIGGALLGFLALAKIFPGLLLVYLLARGEKRALLWSVIFGAIFCLLSLGLFGLAPFEAFFSYQLGRLANGEAFSFAFEIPRAMLVNSSFTGIPYRLQQLGLLSNVDSLAQLWTWTIGFLLLALAWVLGRRWRDAPAESSLVRRHGELGLWLALLLLAQMRSPFLPWGYGSFVVLWLLATLLVMPSTSGAWRLRGVFLVLCWCVIGTALPLPWGGPLLVMDYSFALLGTALALALASIAIVRSWRVTQLNPETQRS